MGQVSAVLRRVQGGYAHWCPGCERMQVIPDGWDFDGNVEKPTFNPSVRTQYNGADADQIREDGSRAPSACCHYFLHAGELRFCADSTHALAGQNVPLPPLPADLRDDWGQ